jgi:hypothetical protein
MKPTDRASNMSRSLACPASPTVMAIVGERDRDDGYCGTMIHWMIADRLIREFGATPPEGGLQPPQVPAGYTVPSDSLWIVDWALRHVRDTIPPDWALMVEVEFCYEFERWILTGHGDLIAQSPCGTKIMGRDWKCVYTPVDKAEENDQVLSYQVLCKLDWPETNEIDFKICSPRLRDEDKITTSIVSGRDLDLCVLSLDKRKCEALDNPTKLCTGIKQCNFCAGVSCPAIRAEAEYMEMTLTPEMLANLKREPDDTTLVDFVLSARTLTKPIKEASDMLHERLQKAGEITSSSGLRVSGYSEIGGYDINDPIGYIQACRNIGFTDENIARAFTPSLKGVTEEIVAIKKCAKTGKDPVTAKSIIEGYLKPFMTPTMKRMLKIQ